MEMLGGMSGTRRTLNHITRQNVWDEKDTKSHNETERVGREGH